MVVCAWYMDDSAEDQRAPHQQTPPRPVTTAELEALGVLQWHLDAADVVSDPLLAQVRRERGYTYTDTITISPEKLPNYEQKLKTFYEEHLHTDEEIRLCLDGSGYFDVRDKADRWIRVAVSKGDMLVLPAGIYHRFTLDERNYIQAMRLFVGEPVWTPYNRVADGTDAMPCRSSYVTAFVEGGEAVSGGAGATSGATIPVS